MSMSTKAEADVVDAAATFYRTLRYADGFVAMVERGPDAIAEYVGGPEITRIADRVLAATDTLDAALTALEAEREA